VKALRVVVVDDHQLFAKGLQLLLNANSEHTVEVLEICADAAQTGELVRHHAPDLVVVDLQMPPPGGLGAIALAKEADAHVPVLTGAAVLNPIRDRMIFRRKGEG
jgi:DNA-binding NarL/FixJ family response regulator